MSERRSFYRKIAYFCGIAVLLVPLSFLSMPSSRGKSGENAGGKLAQLRKESNLSQANLGEIDPASETMRLATLGLGGIATNILWDRAIHYKKTEDWTNLSATLEQITKLQPNFISVWQFQAWNLSYNVSVEFDDYRDRYTWVIRGINFLKSGERYNTDDPRLMWDIGWFIAQKIGRADEKKQFRELFREDDDFHPADRTRAERDNWLVGKEWFLKAQNVVDNKGKSIKGKSPLIFHSDSAMAQINYSEALEEDGTHGERAKAAWEKAAREWRDYGARSIMSTFGVRINLNDEERVRKEVENYQRELNELTSGIYDKIAAERRAQLTAEQQAALLMPEAARTNEQHQLVAEAERAMEFSHKEVAERIQEESPDKGKEAMRLARLAIEGEERATIIDRYRDIVNFEYWRTRCEFEQTPDALTAREYIFKGDQALERADLLAAKDFYDRGMRHWRKVFDAFPSIVEEGTTGEDLVDVVVRYRSILNEIDEPFPQDFILRDIVEMHDRENRLGDIFTTPAGEATPDATESPDAATPPATEGAPPEPPAEAEAADAEPAVNETAPATAAPQPAPSGEQP